MKKRTEEKRRKPPEGALLLGCPDRWHQAHLAVEWGSSPSLRLARSQQAGAGRGGEDAVVSTGVQFPAQGKS